MGRKKKMIRISTRHILAFELDPAKEQELKLMAEKIQRGELPHLSGSWNKEIWDKLRYILNLKDIDMDKYNELQKYFGILKSFLYRNDPDYNSRVKAHNREYSKRPEAKIIIENNRNKPERVEHMKRYWKEYAQRPEVKEKIRQRQNTPESKEYRRQYYLNKLKNQLKSDKL